MPGLPIYNSRVSPYLKLITFQVHIEQEQLVKLGKLQINFKEHINKLMTNSLYSSVSIPVIHKLNHV